MFLKILEYYNHLDSVTHPSSSIQGESDSEPELISAISSNLDSMFTSDSSDADFSEADDDIFDNSDKPIFLTAKGPVHLETGQNDLIFINTSVVFVSHL